MLIQAQAFDLLASHGVHVSEAGPSDLVLASPNQPPHHVEVITRSGAPSPAQLRKLLDKAHSPHVGALLVADSLSPAARSALDEAGWSWIDQRSQAGVLRMPDQAITLGETVDAGPAHPPHRGRPPWGALTIGRILATGTSLTQRDLAAAADITQGRVSQVLQDLTKLELVTRRGLRGATYHAVDVDALITWWLDTYPGPGGLSSYWTSLLNTREQALRAADVLLKGSAGSKSVLSGDIAADFIAPWRQPVSALVYTSRSIDMTPHGFIPTAPQDATLTICAPQDRGVWPAPSTQQFLRRLTGQHDDVLADPLQVLYDIGASGGPDADQATHRLRARILAGATKSLARHG